MSRKKEDVEFNIAKQKERYLEECQYEDSTKTQILTTFKACAKFEKTCGKDVCEFTQENIVELLKQISASTRGYLSTRCSHISGYVDWCIEKNIISDKDNKYSKDNIKPIINEIIPNEEFSKRFFNIENLATFLNDIYAPENKFILYSYFLGIKVKELVNIKASDVNKENMTVKLIDREDEAEVDKQWIELMENANNSKSYDEDGKIDNPNRRPDLYNYTESDYVLKYTKRKESNNIPLSESAMKKRARIIKEQTRNSQLNESDIRLNGLINYIKNKYCEKGITLETAILQTKYYTETKEYIKKFGSNIHPRTLKSNIKDYLACFVTENELFYENLAIRKEIDTLALVDKYKEIIAKARIGQSLYRDKLLERYGRKCAICDIKNEKMLVASHIKAYVECEDGEQIDINNGLLLCANHDKLFDNHLISFDATGKIMISDKIEKEEYESLRISANVKLSLYSNNQKYLIHHLNVMKSNKN